MGKMVDETWSIDEQAGESSQTPARFSLVFLIFPSPASFLAERKLPAILLSRTPQITARQAHPNNLPLGGPPIDPHCCQ
jgi:hypothetical protein